MSWLLLFLCFVRWNAINQGKSRIIPTKTVGNKGFDFSIVFGSNFSREMGFLRTLCKPNLMQKLVQSLEGWCNYLKSLIFQWFFGMCRTKSKNFILGSMMWKIFWCIHTTLKRYQNKSHCIIICLDEYKEILIWRY